MIVFPPLPRCTCHWAAEVHTDVCPYFIELLVRMRMRRHFKGRREGERDG